ncbi:hypothetical protein EDB19DRAFT_1853484 [Suillus lakei]|nr:hypothetical protein EDB19DRAFT_1853484 [Suillus lakei]
MSKSSSMSTQWYDSVLIPTTDTRIASSVDAERAFSGGRLQVNRLQHGISSQTFKAPVAIGSWFTPYARYQCRYKNHAKENGKGEGEGKIELPP